MTTSKSNLPNVVVVDGSNIATEGRSMPSLSQLNDAVMAYKEEFPDAVITVVVDATFGHRIDKKESAEFDLAVAHNELVAPPAGAIGRGDAFVLSIANKVGARILSNDSFQEFHGDYPWLFDEGRLIGGKPVPYVGWVFVERLPVKGPASRKSQRAARGEPKPIRRSASKAASLPMPVPTAPPPSGRRRATEPAAPTRDAQRPLVPEAAPPVAATGGPAVNDLLPFIDFVERHPVGSSVNGVVESYSSHGAYVMVGDLRGYVPLRLMADPPPRSAREVMRVDDAVTLVVVSFAPARRSVDLAVPHMVPSAELVATPELEELVEAVSPRRAAKRGSKKAAAPAPTETPAPAKRPSKRAARSGGPAEVAVAEPIALDESPPAPAKRATRKSPAKAAVPAKTPRKRSATKVAAEAPADDAPQEVPAAKRAPRRRAAETASVASAQADATPSVDGEGTAPTSPTRSRSRKRAASPVGAP